MKFLRKLVALLSLLAANTHAANTHAAEALNVSVASNFLGPAKEIAGRFSESTGIAVNLIPGSTGHLYAQIVAGAPYDVFLAADLARPQALIKRGQADAGSYTVYAKGYLVLWSTDPLYEVESCYSAFLAGKFRYLAIANPDTAPYGEAARKFLQAIGRWDLFSDQLAYGENVLQAFQFVASGNASLGLVAASHAIAHQDRRATCFSRLPEEFAATATVEQGGVVLTSSEHRKAAVQFLEFIQSPEIAGVLAQRGYHSAMHSN